VPFSAHPLRVLNAQKSHTVRFFEGLRQEQSGTEDALDVSHPTLYFCFS